MSIFKCAEKRKHETKKKTNHDMCMYVLLYLVFFRCLKSNKDSLISEWSITITIYVLFVQEHLEIF